MSFPPPARWDDAVYLHICAQRLQAHRDLVNGVESVDFGSLRARLGQNGVPEKLTRL